MELADILVADAVSTFHNISSKKRLLQGIAEQASVLNGLSQQKVFEALQERELLGATGMGKGIAVPHARMADVSNVIGFFTRLDDPIDFDSVDRQPVDLVFTLLAPNRLHLRHRSHQLVLRLPIGINSNAGLSGQIGFQKNQIGLK